MIHIALRYALLTRHKAVGADDADKCALAQTMLDAHVRFVERLVDFIDRRDDDMDTEESRGTVALISSWVEAPLAALTAPEAIAYLPKNAAEQLAELALKALDTHAEKGNDYKFYKDAHAMIAQVTNSLLSHADAIADHAKANELSADHMKTRQPVSTRKPIILKPRADAPAA